MGKSVNDLSQIGNLIEFESEEEKTYKTIATTSIVTTVSYMMGFDMDRLNLHFSEYNKELIEKIVKNKPLTIIRHLSRLRTSLMQKYKKIDEELLFGLAGIENSLYIDKNDIKQLRKLGIEVVRPNSRANKYIESINGLILSNIDACADEFPEWLNFDYIRDLFVVPKYKEEHTQRSEAVKYKSNLNNYPFQMYIHWKKPEDVGNMLLSDQRFLTIIYKMNGDVFDLDKSAYRDASSDTKSNIYSFISNSQKIIFAVDCENCDVFKLYGVLKNLDEEQLTKVDKIVLYDDIHTSDGWDWFQKYVSIPIEHKEIERVAENKSLVDVVMTAGVVQAHYRDNVDAFILCSSDSDFWGVISTLDSANFLVLYEYSKTGKSIKEQLTLKSIYHCSIDDFYTGNAEEIKKSVLRACLERYIKDEELNGKNGYDIARDIYEKNYIEASDKEINKFFEKYVRSIRLKCDNEGNFGYEITK